MQHGNVIDRVCPWSVCNALTCESLDLQSSFLVRRYIFRIINSIVYTRSSGKDQGHRSKRILLGIAYLLVSGMVVCVSRWSAFDLCFTAVISYLFYQTPNLLDSWTPPQQYIRGWVLGQAWKIGSEFRPPLSYFYKGWKLRNFASVFYLNRIWVAFASWRTNIWNLKEFRWCRLSI